MIRTILSYPVHLLLGIPDRARRVLRRVVLGCLFFFILVVLGPLACLALARQASAAQTTPPAMSASVGAGYAVCLLIDESNSMSELGGIGSDPDRLRIDAARILISYLGLDESGGTGRHAAAIIRFGTTPYVAADLTPLDPKGRTRLLDELGQPVDPLGWSDQLAALKLAQSICVSGAGARRPAIILLTDGYPEWDAAANSMSATAYLDELRATAVALADQDVPVVIILLANEATDADPDIGAVWRPIWQEMSAMTPAGRFHEVREAGALPGIYHDIAVAMAGRTAAGAVVDTEVAGKEIRRSVWVEDGLASLTFVVSKSSPSVVARVLLPSGELLTADAPGVQRSGGNNSTEEIWRVENPPAGEWVLMLSGEGWITVWKDYVVAVPTLTPRPTATPEPTATMTPVFTASPPPAAPALAVMATAAPVTPVPAVVPAPPASNKRGSGPLLLSITVLGVAVVLLLLLRQRRGQRPKVDGVLRFLETKSGGLNGAPIDLSTLSKTSLWVGGSRPDVALPGAEGEAGWFAIGAGKQGDDGPEMVLTGCESVSVNSRPLVGFHLLHDMDVISCGTWRVRYENLRLRQRHSVSATGSQQSSLRNREVRS